jgi:hypothetical protein
MIQGGISLPQIDFFGNFFLVLKKESSSCETGSTGDCVWSQTLKPLMDIAKVQECARDWGIRETSLPSIILFRVKPVCLCSVACKAMVKSG